MHRSGGPKILQGGDTLHLTPNESIPYTEVIDTHATNAKWGGTAARSSGPLGSPVAQAGEVLVVIYASAKPI